MKFVIQRVKNASCTVDNQVIGEIQQGFCVFIGVSNEDTTEIADKMIKKLIGMRIFDDENDKINLSLADVNGGLLLISQFTLYADCKKGNRPSYIKSMKASDASIMYDLFNKKLSEYVNVETGIFQSDMKVSITNDGPVTILLESE